MENKYQRGKIYKLVSSQTDKIYIGSTIQKLKYRKSQHEYKYKKNENKSSKFICCYDDFDIILIKEYPCNSKEELIREEGNMIKQYLDICVNYQIAGRTQKESKKEYYEKNKKEYYEKNKTKILEKRKEYRNKNKNLINKKQKEICNCECGFTYTKRNKARHLKTKKHQSNSARYNLI